jgi:hypothetical protein
MLLVVATASMTEICIVPLMSPLLPFLSTQKELELKAKDAELESLKVKTVSQMLLGVASALAGRNRLGAALNGGGAQEVGMGKVVENWRFTPPSHPFHELSVGCQNQGSS